jgi:4a-hydroxytetrahydrobiopterin dehydratase
MNGKIIDLTTRRCRPCEGDTPPLQQDEVEGYLDALPGWELTDNQIARKFEFKNFHQTMAFVNAVAWIAHSENHHPDMEISYRFCTVRYTTHAIGGLSENDFICAARVSALLPPV